MYSQIIGRWIDAPIDEFVEPARSPQPINWPRGEDGIISARIVDTNDVPLELDLGGSDSIKLCVGYDFSSSVFVVSGTNTGADVGEYQFAITASSTSDLDGPLVYSVVAVKGGVSQQVISPAYFTITPAVPS